MIEKAKELLKDNGYFFCYCPNGSEEYLKINKKAFHSNWGLVHPFYLNINFFVKQFSKNPYYIGSNLNHTGLMKILNNEQYIDDLTGEELLVLSRPNIKLK
jgi:hypothetical protein